MTKQELLAMGQKMMELRKGSGLSQRALANIIGVRNASVSRYETGNIEARRSVIDTYAKYFGVSPLWLLGVTEDRYYKMEEGDSVKLPVLGTIAAGIPIEAQEDILDYVWVGSSLRVDFALRVKGDSMINARIQDGDIVVLRQQPSADTGDIVAALIDGDVTLKRIIRTPSALVLHPENPSYKDIIFSGKDTKQVTILGVVKYAIFEVA